MRYSVKINKTAPFKVFVIIGSARPGRIGHTIAEWYVQVAKGQRPEMQFEIIDLAEWNLPLLNEPIPARSHIYQHNHTKRWSAKISEADGYIIVTPEYNHGYPASLKNALDYLYDEWNSKPVGLVGYSWDGAKRVIEQLQQVLAGLKMIPLPKYLPIQLRPDMFSMQRQLVDAETHLAHYANEVAHMINEMNFTLKGGADHERAV